MRYFLRGEGHREAGAVDVEALGLSRQWLPQQDGRLRDVWGPGGGGPDPQPPPKIKMEGEGVSQTHLDTVRGRVFSVVQMVKGPDLFEKRCFKD